MQLNPFQLAIDFEHKGNYVISAETGAGKTYAAELLAQPTTIISVPTNALLEQHQQTFAKYLTNVHVMTNEALLSLVRSNADISNVNTLVIDEAHYLGDKQRGATLEEAIIRANYKKPLQTILLSGTLPEAPVFGEWLSRLNGLETKVCVSDWKPYHTTWHVSHYEKSSNYYWNLDNGFQTFKRDLESVYTSDKVYLVFVHDKGYSFNKAKEVLTGCPGRVWTYHATMSQMERQYVLDCFKPGDVLITTSALEVGINKEFDYGFFVGTESYARGVIDNRTIKQAAGRIGRFDEGQFFIITSDKERDFTTVEPVVSQMFERDSLRLALCEQPVLRDSLAHEQGQKLPDPKLQAQRRWLIQNRIIDDKGLTPLGELAYQYCFNPELVLAWASGVDAYADIDNQHMKKALVLANAPSWCFSYIPKGEINTITDNWHEFNGFGFMQHFKRLPELQQFTAKVTYLHLAGMELDLYPEIQWFVDRLKNDQRRLESVLHQLGV
jgi:hypothetical protein